jgi:hypothetical protein
MKLYYIKSGTKIHSWLASGLFPKKVKSPFSQNDSKLNGGKSGGVFDIGSIGTYW